MPATPATEVPGLAIADGELRLELSSAALPRADPTELGFRIVGEGGDAVTDFDLEHEKRMHLIVVRRDLTGFQHLHPRMDADGNWSTPIELPSAGSYRVFADFSHGAESETLGADLAVDGGADYESIPAPSMVATTRSGYEVELAADGSRAGSDSELAFTVTRAGSPVQIEPYLGADGHLVALREGDLGYLHVHPLSGGEHGAEEHGGSDDSHAAAEAGDPIRFMTEFPSAGSYRLFLQFRAAGEVHTAEFTREVNR